MASRVTTLIVASIVVATLIAGIIARAQRDDEGPVDLIVFNGNVYPGDGEGELAEAVAVRGNTIFRVGSNREIKRLRRPQTTVIDAHGGAVVPGFNDSHVHFLSAGLGLSEINLLDATTAGEIAAHVRRWAAANTGRPWVTGRGWHYTAFTGGLPTRQFLDEVVPDRPAYLIAYDAHSGWANTAALKLAGITSKTASPKNGVVVKDARGEPTGVLKEAAMRLMDGVLPQPDRAARLSAIRAGIREAHRLGVTSVQDAGGTAGAIDLLDELRRGNELKVRVYHALSAGPAFIEADAVTLEETRRKYPDDPLLKAGAVKLMVDGVIETHTAAMIEPYANRPSKGLPTFTPADLNRIVTRLDERGWQIWIHAIGDGGIRMALDAFEAAAEANPEPARGRRHRIEHIESIDPSDVPRFGALGVIASMQPFHANPDPSLGTVWSENLGPERASHAWLWTSIARAGGRLAFGSDWPVVTLDPRLGLQVATNRLSPDGLPEGGSMPEERLPLTAVIDAYTSGAAYASFDEQRKGTLAKGMLADIVILSADIFAAPPERVLDAVVDVTIFDGKVVYDRAEAETEP
ncbi:MAG: amidohydrolase [Vicinamibacterales bacterium]